MGVPASLVQKFAVDECGPVHIIIGDGGNIEGVCKPTLPVSLKAASQSCLSKLKVMSAPDACSLTHCAAIHNMACCAADQRSALSHQQTVATDDLILKLCIGSEQCVLHDMLLPLADLA